MTSIFPLSTEIVKLKPERRKQILEAVNVVKDETVGNENIYVENERNNFLSRTKCTKTRGKLIS